MSIVYKEENKVLYEVKIRNQKEVERKIKQFLHKYDFKENEKLTIVSDNDIIDFSYSRNLGMGVKYSKCDVDFRIINNQLNLEIYVSHTAFNTKPEEIFIKLFDNLINEIKVMSNYEKEDIGEFHDVSKFDTYEEKRKFMNRYNKVMKTPMIISMLGSIILLVVALLTKFSYAIINITLLVLILFFCGNVIFCRIYQRDM